MISYEKRRFYILFLSLLALAATVVFSTAALREEKGIAAAADGGTYNLLLLGRDDASGLTDVMMLISVNPEEERACLMQIPRDTYFRYTENNYRKINGAMHALGARSLADTLAGALAVPIDGYAVVDLAFVRDTVDLIGGVSLNVPCDMDYEDPAQDLSIHLKKGMQTLTGEEAVQFVRYRSGYLRGDIERIDAQKAFVAAFVEAAAKQVEDKDLPRLAWMAFRSVKTDMRFDRALSLLQSARRIPAERITLLTLPGEEVRSEISGAWYYVASRSGVAEALERHFGVVGASSCTDPAHLFGNVKREEFERIYRSYVLPRYYTVKELTERES